jgi:hypothetical protein
MKIKQDVSFEQLFHLRKLNAAWRLLASDSAAFVASFLYKSFLQTNRRAISSADLVDELDNFIYFIKQKYPEHAPSRPAKEYIEIWSSHETAWLSQRYTGRGDTPEIDLTPDAEKALRWLENLQPRTFIGTESRLLTIFQLLKDLNQKIETDSEKILEDLRRQKKEIEDQIEKFQKNGKAERPDATQIKERYFQLDDTANTLLSDFRQVEENFRQLDREVREKMALTAKGKGAFLDDVFGEQDAISDSDQGKSFRAFWEFLIHNDRQQEFEELLENILKQPEIYNLGDKGVLPRFRDFLLEAGNKVYVVNNQLTGQLTKYLADQGRAENKRILELVLQIERKALGLREGNLPKHFFSVPFLKPHLNLGMNRPLFRVPDETPLQTPMSSENSEKIHPDQLNKLFSSNHVNEQDLLDLIEKMLIKKDQISLEELIAQHPLQKGLVELITYLKVAEKRPNTHISEALFFEMEFHREQHLEKRIRCPQVIFQRISL